MLPKGIIEEEKSQYEDRGQRSTELRAEPTPSFRMPHLSQINEDVSFSLSDLTPTVRHITGSRDPPPIHKEPWVEQWDDQIESLRKKRFEGYEDKEKH